MTDLGLPELRGRLQESMPRQALGQLESGPAAATVAFGGTMIGVGVRSMTTVAVDPPRVLVALDAGSQVAEGIEIVGTFALNIFDEGTTATPAIAPGVEFGLDAMIVTRGVAGNPLIEDSVAQLECAVQSCSSVGNLRVFLADVTDVRARAGARLDLVDGKLRNFVASRDDATYRELRRAILERQMPLEADLLVSEIVEQLEVERANVTYALTRLTHERLVIRRTSERYSITPVDETLIASMLRARRILMVGITDCLISDLTDAEIASVVRAAEATRRPPGASDVGMENESSVSVFRTFNELIVTLAGSPTLLDTYRGLSVPTVMGRVLWRLDWSTLHDVLSERALEFADALAARDREAAAVAIRNFNDCVYEYAVGVLRSTGGQL
jgi:4-nitrophenol 2-monooxygenase / 4-nitrocatechol 4-monooxygenase, reductase component